MINLFTKNAPYRKQFNQQVFHNPNFPSSPIQPEQKTNPLPSQDNLGQLVDLLKTFITQNSDAIK